MLHVHIYILIHIATYRTAGTRCFVHLFTYRTIIMKSYLYFLMLNKHIYLVQTAICTLVISTYAHALYANAMYFL